MVKPTVKNHEIKQIKQWEEVTNDIGKKAMKLMATRGVMHVDADYYSMKDHYAAIFKRYEMEGAPVVLFMPGKAEVK